MGSVDRKDTTAQLLNRVRMRQVALLLAIHEEHTLHKAALRMGLTQPAATKMLHELEETLGFKLFDRIHRGLHINPAGVRVTEYFQSIQGTMASLNRELKEIRQGGAGRLAIGSIMAASPGRLTHVLLKLRQSHPLLSIEVAVDTSDRLLPQLRDGVLEAVIGRMPKHVDSNYQFRAIDDEELLIVTAPDHPLAERRRVPLDRLLDYDWVLQPPGSPMRAVVEQEFRAHGLAMPRGLIETGSMLTTTDLVRHSESISVLPATVAQDYARNGLLYTLPYRLERKLEAYGSIVRRDRPLSPAAREFLTLIHNTEPC
ncbi:MAG: LysR family transcriptional regulator [Lautropia sp.]|nr:LysR family transcriptional regulator [Lautropia sp.]